MKKKNILVESLGWYGVLAILSAYALLSLGVIPADGYAYQLLNLTGAIGIVVDSWWVRNWQPAVLNIVWVAIAVIAVARIAIG